MLGCFHCKATDLGGNEIFMKPPKTLVDGVVWKIKKALYGLRTSPIAWETEREGGPGCAALPTRQPCQSIHDHGHAQARGADCHPQSPGQMIWAIEKGSSGGDIEFLSKPLRGSLASAKVREYAWKGAE